MSTRLRPSMVATYTDNTMQTFALACKPFFSTGDQVPNGSGGTVLAGGYVDIKNSPIIDKSVAGKERQFFTDSPDGTSLLQLPSPTVTGLEGKAVFAGVQFEYTTRDQSGASTYGVLPSPIAVLMLDQDQATCSATRPRPTLTTTVICPK